VLVFHRTLDHPIWVQFRKTFRETQQPNPPWCPTGRRRGGTGRYPKFLVNLKLNGTRRLIGKGSTVFCGAMVFRKTGNRISQEFAGANKVGPGWFHQLNSRKSFAHGDMVVFDVTSDAK